MRQRGQASVETVALIAVALAVAAALLLGIVRLAPPFTATLVRVLSGVVAPGSQSTPGLDGLEVALLDAATSPDGDGPTMLDVRTLLRARVGRAAGDAAFLQALRPLVARALPPNALDLAIESIGVTDSATEVAWLRTRLHPDLWVQGAEAIVGAAGIPGGVYSLGASLGLLGGDQPGGIAPGAAAGDVSVALAGRRVLVFRRRADAGFALIADQTASWREKR
jgi:hypothetical protein